MPLLADHPGAAVYAGGADLLVKRRAGLIEAGTLVCLERLGELKGVRREGGDIVIGPAATATGGSRDYFWMFPQLSDVIRGLSASA
jgi:CO/xanthine dehydrogenase FAD-binding subunit